MMAEGTFELHPGDALYPETVLELSDVPRGAFDARALHHRCAKGLAVWSCRGRACGEGGG